MLDHTMVMYLYRKASLVEPLDFLDLRLYESYKAITLHQIA